jgi:glycogen phosphorylase
MNKPAPRATDPDTIRAEILEKLAYSIGKDPAVAKRHDWLNATVLALRDRIIDRWMESTRAAYQAKAKRVYYLSLEFLIGRLLRDALSNLELNEAFTKALQELNVDIDLVAALEPDAALGNGGLGRLAACFMESMASLGIRAYGYGIRYNHGLFRQKMKDGWQVELPENWLEHGNPWEFGRREDRLRDRLRRLRSMSGSIWQQAAASSGSRAKALLAVRLRHARSLAGAASG